MQRGEQEQPQGIEDRDGSVSEYFRLVPAHYNGDRVTKVPSPRGGLKEQLCCFREGHPREEVRKEKNQGLL